METIASGTSLAILISLFGIGALGSLLWRKNDSLSNGWSSFFAISGSVWGIIFAIAALMSKNALSFKMGASFSALSPLFSFSFAVDKLSAFFIMVISIVALFCSVYGVGYVKHFYKTYNIGTLGFFYHLFIAGMLLVVTAGNGLFFLVAWEIMSIASYFLVVYDRNDARNVKAGLLYLIMTHAGTAFIILAFLLCYKFTGSFDFAVVKSGVALIPATTKNIIFVLCMIGFGTKAGIIPLHIWLPSAHPAAPSHVSALMSGVMIKTGIYMMIRMFFDILQPIPSWWGLVVLVVGSISSLLGVLYALTEHDIKRLLAYHSIENIGIILLGLGSSMTFYSLNMPRAALLGLVAGLFHTLNHAIFKSLLFLSAGSVLNQTHTRNMEEYGGLARLMPQTAFFFLVGSMAISALPPFNGFFSEWVTFQTLVQGIARLDFWATGIFMIATGSLAFTGGLALACFVKVFAATFLARPRSVHALRAKESSWSMRFGMGALALMALLIGIFSSSVTRVLANIGKNFDIFQHTAADIFASSGSTLQITGLASVSAPALFALLLIVCCLMMIIIKFVINKKQKETVGATWDCGTDLAPRMEITATGFAQSLIVIFKNVLKPQMKKTVTTNDGGNAKSLSVRLHVVDPHQTYIYEPLRAMVMACCLRIKAIQSGNINAYILYIVAALVISLFFVL